MTRIFYLISAAVFGLVGALALLWPSVLWSLIVLVPLFALGVRDATQTRKAVLRNFPVIGHFRYLFEMIRPEINQYFIESDVDGTPYNRELRSLSYQRSKGELQTLPFGTQRNVYSVGYEWIGHSISAVPPRSHAPRIPIGVGSCEQPYDASLFNISAMSFGSLSDRAVLALNGGAKKGGFFHNTGEGSISPYHLQPGGDLCWQIGTGYFGCRSSSGGFDEGAFREEAARDTVRLIEIKLSQGAKPGHGGILPAAKITKELAAIRKVPMGQDVISPPAHTAFRDPRGLLEFVARLREVSGKPVGFKLCVGVPSEFLGLCMAMTETGIVPDFISVDGGEGGTGAAPFEFTNSVGAPLTEGLVLVHNALVGFGLRRQIKVIASGKVASGFALASRLAAGADLCNAARGFMFALGCIQARRCNSNHCPVGVATQNPGLIRGLDVDDKARRVASYHHETVHSFLELLGAAGIDHPDTLGPWHIQRRVSELEVRSYAEIFPYLESGQLLEKPYPDPYRVWMQMATPDAFSLYQPVSPQA